MSGRIALNKVLPVLWLAIAIISLASCKYQAVPVAVTETAITIEASTPVISQTATPLEEPVSTVNGEEPEITATPAGEPVVTASSEKPEIKISPTASGFASMENSSAACIAAPGNQVIAFVSDRRRKDNLDIWIIDVESGEEVAITSTASQDWHPLWSPDGQKLAYLSAESQEDVFLVVVDFDTCETISRLRVPDVVTFSWFANSALLWLDTWSGVLQYNFLEDMVTQYSENVRSAVEDLNSMFLAMRSQTSPELYLYDLLILDRENNVLPIQFVSELHVQSSVYHIAWAYHTSRLSVTFLPSGPQATGGISLLAFVDGAFVEVASLSGQEPSLDYCYPAWSPTNSYISYVVGWHYAEDPCLGDVDVAGDDLQQVSHVSGNATITQQPWSPAGTQIVFSQNARSPWWAPSRSYGSPGEGSIWVSDFDGSNQRLLTDSDWYDGEAVWRP